MKRLLLCIFISLCFCGGLTVMGGTEVKKLPEPEQVYKGILDSGEYADVEKWGSLTAVVTKDRHSIKYTLLGGVWTDIDLHTFSEADIPVTSDTMFTVNDIEALGDQLIAGCNDGILLVITDCVKCYRLRKVCDFDITGIDFEGDRLIIVGRSPDERAELSADEVRQSKIAPSEVKNRMAQGCILIDVRDEADYIDGHIQGAVGIPIEKIGYIDKYPRDSQLVFYCYSGKRSAIAVSKALSMGFVNAYNAGGYEELKHEF